MPDVPAVHVVEVDEEEAEPDPGGDVALQHDDTEEETAEHSAQLGAAEKPGAGEEEVVSRQHHQSHLHYLN